MTFEDKSEVVRRGANNNKKKKKKKKNPGIFGTIVATTISTQRFDILTRVASCMSPLELMRQLMEQKMKQKRQTSGMVQASDARSTSAKARNGLAARPISTQNRGRELHGYDGPLQFTMSPENPDSVIAVQSAAHAEDEVSSQVETLRLSADDGPDVEDEESTPVAPTTPDNVLTAPIAPFTGPVNFINSNSNFHLYEKQRPITLDTDIIGLKQVMSTPLLPRTREVLSLGDDLPSPILRTNSHEMNNDSHYQSDHSDHSSADGQAKSSRSSVRSSPANSPLGSTYMLAGENTYVGVNYHQRELKLIPPRKMEFQKPEVAATRGRGLSGLRPPAVKSRGNVRPASGLPRPNAMSNIPRPPSRIPGPRMRSASSVQSLNSKKGNWMDGCY
uniref:Uncharacterized protein n=1 Tax=Timema poppense TaxID=170557 RepID=A0A7R9GW89_TIMPO|nr:unnamed protein product [Timema poppensis]